MNTKPRTNRILALLTILALPMLSSCHCLYHFGLHFGHGHRAHGHGHYHPVARPRCR